MRHGESTRKMVARYFLDSKDNSLVGPCGKAVGSGGWKGRWETPEKLKNGVRLGGRCCRARSRSPPPLVLGEGKQGAREDGGKPQGFTWMVLMFSVSGMGEEASHIAPWYGGSSDAGRGHWPSIRYIPQSSGQGRKDNSE